MFQRFRGSLRAIIALTGIASGSVSCGNLKNNGKKHQYTRGVSTLNFENDQASKQLESRKHLSKNRESDSHSPATNREDMANDPEINSEDKSPHEESESLLELINSIENLSQEELPEGNFPVCENDSDPDGFCPSSEGTEVDGMAFTCSSQKYNLIKNPDNFVAVNPFADVLWPGSLIQARPLLQGVLNPAPVAGRSPGSITMTLAAEGEGSFSSAIEKPSLAAVTEGIRNILSGNSQIFTPAKFSYNMHRVYSNSQLSVAMGLQVDTPFSFDIGADFTFNSKDQKSRVLIDFTQEYYTIAYSQGDGFHGFFLPEVGPEELKAYISDGNPLAYISSVTYGRKLYLMFESKSKISDLEAALKASFQGYGIGTSISLANKYKEVLNDAHIRTWVLGGNAEDALAALNQVDESGLSFVNLQNLIEGGANFSKGNPGLPVSYTVRHVKDASQINLILTTEYTARECNPTGDVQNPSLWGLRVSLEEVVIEKENGFCEFLHETGEFQPCLQLAYGSDPTKSDIFCSGEIRKAKPGDILKYGLANHSKVFDIVQRPGEEFTVSGNVKEVDGNRADTVLEFSNNFRLNEQYEWSGWQNEFVVSGSFEGCKATMKWKMAWIEQFLAGK